MRKSNYLWLLLVAVLLLPAQEMAAKKKKEKEVTDRELWAGVLYQMAAPVLSNMSEGKLQENMQVELSPTWDGRDKRVTYMECFGRLMAGLAPWLSLPDDDTAEGKQRRQLREWALKSYAQAVDPESQDYLLWRKEGQPLVDAMECAGLQFPACPEAHAAFRHDSGTFHLSRGGLPRIRAFHYLPHRYPPTIGFVGMAWMVAQGIVERTGTCCHDSCHQPYVR